MEDNNLKNQFSADLLRAVSKVLGEAAESPRAYDSSDTKTTAHAHKSYADAINHAVSSHNNLSVSQDDLSKHLENDPSHGNVRNLKIPATHKTTGEKHMIHAQIYNQGGKRPYELVDTTAYKHSVKEEVSLDEKHGGADYAIYHKSYTDAVDHALSHHGKSGLSVSDDDKFHHIGLMSKKPSEGNTTTLNLPATDHATGKEHTIHMQVYNRGGSHPYELNTYSSKNSTQRQIDKVAAKRKKALGEEAIEEKLIGGQAKLDVDKDGKLEKSDFMKLRNKKIAAKKHEKGESKAQEKAENDEGCTCDDVDEAYGGARVTLKPNANVRNGGLDKHHYDAVKAKLAAFEKKHLTKEETELDEARGRPPKPGSAAYIAQQKAKEAGEAEGPEPDEHIMNQVRKAADSGMMPHKIKYSDGSTHALHRVHARAVIAKYNRLKPFAKEEMQAEIAKSHEHMMKHAKD